MSVREAQRFNFIVNLATHFEKAQVNLPGNLVIKDNVKYRIKPLTIPLSDITISPSTLNFTQDLINAKRNKQLLVMEGATITATLTTTNDISEAFVTSSDFSKSKIRVKDSKKNKVKINPEIDSSETVAITLLDAANGSYQVSIPITATINSSKNTFTKNKIPLASGLEKTIILPIKINMESAISNGLDLILEGDLNQDLLINIETLEEATISE
jgi:predicted secreted protein